MKIQQMKTSELIERLQRDVTEHGDAEVRIDITPNVLWPRDKITVLTLSIEHENFNSIIYL